MKKVVTFLFAAPLFFLLAAAIGVAFRGVAPELAPTPAVALVAPATPNDWLPPNPYAVITDPSQVPLPSDAGCPPRYHHNQQCAEGCRNTYREGVMALTNFAHDFYETTASNLDVVMEHIGATCQSCLANATTQAERDACWAENQVASNNAWQTADTQILALQIYFFDAGIPLKNTLFDCLAGCCVPDKIKQP